ncbi:MAG: diaminopimelate decarboxylase [Actinomycetaceae bacterium]|nr:diaminopimelate decarboxylase [Actinomycetaceae bacterium]
MSTALENERCPQPHERPDLWPWSAKFEGGQLWLGGRPATQLVEDFGSPVYVLDESDLAGRATVWATVMAEEFWDGYGMGGGSAYYAAKAMMSARVIEIVTAAGMGVDTASLGELTTALRAGADPDMIGLHGNNKSDEELRLAISAGERGIARIVIDSPDEVGRVAQIASELGRKARVMIRVTTGVHAGGHQFIATAHEDQKFGLSLANGTAKRVALDIQNYDSLDFVGVHSHIGSQIRDLDAFFESASRLLGLVKDLSNEGVACREVDLGGGYAITYTGADPEPASPKEIARALAGAVRAACEELDLQVPHVSIEPGRSTVGPTTVTLYKVGTVKEVPLEGMSRLYVSIDGGMSDNIRPALYEANYTALLANREGSSALVNARVVGKHCESGDIVVHDLALPADIKRGDILAVPATGAYGHAMSSNYNMLTRPGTLGVGAGEPHWIVYPEKLDHLLARDAFLDANN